MSRFGGEQGSRDGRGCSPRLKLGVGLAIALAALLSLGRLHSLVALRSSSTVSGSAGEWSGRCVGVADGDTISVLHDGAAVKIRLNAVDCPERVQAYGAVARRFTSDLVFGKTVTVRPTDTDRYGRTVGDVETPDGRTLNEALVIAGLAWWYRQYAPHDARLEALEAEARRARRGLWADRDPVPSWEFRRER